MNSGRIFTDMQNMEVDILKATIHIYKLGDNNTFTKSKQKFSV